VQAHANDLRSEIATQWDSVAAGPQPQDAGLDAFVHQVVDDWRAAPLNEPAAALAGWAEKVTRTPADCNEDDIVALRRCGLDDRAIHDAAQAIAYFNYINRIADALGVEVEPGLPRWGRAAR